MEVTACRPLRLPEKSGIKVCFSHETIDQSKGAANAGSLRQEMVFTSLTLNFVSMPSSSGSWIAGCSSSTVDQAYISDDWG